MSQTAAAPLKLSDAMRTVAVNGAYNASRALSKWIRRGVRLNSDGFEQVCCTDVSSLAGNSEEPVAAIHLELDGDLHGDLVLLFPATVGLSLVDMMMDAPEGTSTTFGELECSALCETANIVGSAYANSLAKWLDLTISPGVPEIQHDMAESLVDSLVSEHMLDGDRILVAKTEFLLNDRAVEWSMLLLPTRDSVKVLEHRCQTENMRREALHTIAVNGAFSASRAMSKWLDKGVKISTDGFLHLPFHALASSEQGEPIVALLTTLSERLSGFAMLTITEDSARQLVDVLMGNPPNTTKEFGEVERSCLEETGNIISSAFVNSWSTWLDIQIEPSVPMFLNDLPGAILGNVLAEQAMVSDEIFLARTEFVVDEQSIEWMFLLLPSPSALRLIETSCE